jgi:hypothetical protein
MLISPPLLLKAPRPSSATSEVLFLAVPSYLNAWHLLLYLRKETPRPACRTIATVSLLLSRGKTDISQGPCQVIACEREYREGRRMRSPTMTFAQRGHAGHAPPTLEALPYLLVADRGRESAASRSEVPCDRTIGSEGERRPPYPPWRKSSPHRTTGKGTDTSHHGIDRDDSSRRDNSGDRNDRDG